jgi:DNA-binding NtrC family response regulator
MDETKQAHTLTAVALIIADDPERQEILTRLLETAGWRVHCSSCFEDYRALAETVTPLLLLLHCAPDSAALKTLLADLQPWLSNDRTYVVVLAEQPSIENAILCTRLGASDYLAWPLAPAELLELAGRAHKLAHYALTHAPATAERRDELAKPRSTERSLIGGSAAMLDLSKQLVRLARSDELRVFISGETGTGKEVIARMIHELSGRSGPFLAVNCAATVESLLESDLFGHEKGAFTGAHATKRGLWEEAADGTLFLDEITETSPAVQAKLLRVLQEGVLRRVGSTREIKVTARVIAATNRDLNQAVKDELFRQDLFYRLGQVLRLPPLRERREDIPLLVEHFCQRARKPVVITPEALETLCAYDWPGNVRELESVIQQLITFSGHFVFREDVLRHIHLEQEERPRVSLPFWSAMQRAAYADWPSVREVRNWYVEQAFNYFRKELVVARKLGVDVRTVNAIIRGEAEAPTEAETPLEG